MLFLIRNLFVACDEEDSVQMKPWDDEETRQFYEEFPDVNEYLPSKGANMRVPLAKCVSKIISNRHSFYRFNL